MTETTNPLTVSCLCFCVIIFIFLGWSICRTTKQDSSSGYDFQRPNQGGCQPSPPAFSGAYPQPLNDQGTYSAAYKGQYPPIASMRLAEVTSRLVARLVNVSNVGVVCVYFMESPMSGKYFASVFFCFSF